MEESSRYISATALAERIVKTCTGFHYSDPKANGRTSHAFVFKDSAGGAVLHDRIQQGLQRNSVIKVDTSTTAFRTCTDELVALLYKHVTNQPNTLQLQNDNLFLPVVVATRGSTTGATTTLCQVRGFATKSPFYESMEVTVVCEILRVADRPGSLRTPGTMAAALVDKRVREMVEAQNTFSALIDLTGFMYSTPMAKAMYALVTAWLNVKNSYNDSGKRFRDGQSRKLGYDAFQEAIYNVLHSIKS